MIKYGQSLVRDKTNPGLDSKIIWEQQFAHGNLFFFFFPHVIWVEREIN